MIKKGQVWIETVIYILIGLILIGMALTFIVPKVNEEKDKSAVEQTIVSLKVLDDKINEVIDRGKDNKRVVEFGMKRGEMYFIPENDKIVFVIDGLTKPYSEPGVSVPVGRVIVETTEAKNRISVNLTLDYGGLGGNLTFNGAENAKKFTSSVSPYRFSIENKGKPTGENYYLIDISKI